MSSFYDLINTVPRCRITLEIMTLQPRCEDVETAEGVAITVTGVAQVRPHPSTFSVSIHVL